MRVLGKDREEGAYRLSVPVEGREVVVLIPDTLLSAEHGVTSRVPHQAAYEWIEREAPRLARTVRDLTSGTRPRAPYDQITLEPAHH